MLIRRGQICIDCGLPDGGDGRGDGLGSCDCPPACRRCRVRPGEDCVCDDRDESDDEEDWGNEL
jgi:hypothetical protein